MLRINADVYSKGIDSISTYMLRRITCSSAGFSFLRTQNKNMPDIAMDVSI